MISAILYDETESELNMLMQGMRDAIAYYTDDESRVFKCNTSMELDRIIDSVDLSDLSCIAFDKETGRLTVKRIREKYPQQGMLLIVDGDLSPREYIRPGMLVSSILIRPFLEDEMETVLQEFVKECIPDPDDTEFFILESKDGILQIPYSKILYLEANAKKVYIRLGREEYGYYETLDNLETVLPKEFVRCHRSFIVNKNQIVRFNASESTLILASDFVIPVSRSYRAMIREILK